MRRILVRLGMLQRHHYHRHIWVKKNKKNQEESEEEGDGEKDKTVVGENDSNMMEWVHVVDDATTTDTSKATASFVESSHKLPIVPVLLITTTTTTTTTENTTRNDDDSTTETIATTTNEDGRSNTDFHNLVNNRNDGSNSSHINSDMDVHYNNDPILEPILPAGIMYTICGPDRSGNVIADLLYAHAFAYGHNITYGGSCCLRPIYPTNTTRTFITGLAMGMHYSHSNVPMDVDSIQYRHLRIDSTGYRYNRFIHYYYTKIRIALMVINPISHPLGDNMSKPF